MLPTLICCLMLVQGSPKARGSLAAKLDAPVYNFDLVGEDLPDALLKVAGQFEVPMGIVWVRTGPAAQSVKVSRKRGTVREIIQAIVGSQPGYTMEERRGLVRVLPRGAVPDRESFLKLKLPDFQVEDEPLEVAEHRLRDLVMAAMRPPEPAAGAPTRGGIGHSQGTEVGAPNVALSLRNVTVEDVLDALSLASNRNVWIVTFLDGQQLTPAGFRRTVSLWNDFPIPDDQQPVWDMFRWGQQPPVVRPGPTR